MGLGHAMPMHANWRNGAHRRAEARHAQYYHRDRQVVNVRGVVIREFSPSRFGSDSGSTSGLECGSRQGSNSGFGSGSKSTSWPGLASMSCRWPGTLSVSPILSKKRYVHNWRMRGTGLKPVAFAVFTRARARSLTDMRWRARNQGARVTLHAPQSTRHGAIMSGTEACQRSSL